MNYYKVGSKYFEEGSGKELGQNDISGGNYLGVKFSDIKNRDAQGNYIGTSGRGYQYVKDELLTKPGWTEQDFSNKGFAMGEYKIPELKNVNSGIVSNTSEIKDKAGNLNAYGSDIKESLGETDWNKYIADLTGRLSSLNSFSVDEINQIANAGVSAGLKYDALIREAEEAKRGGMAKTNVAAGRMGGFMNTQFAGEAAVSPTNAGKWEGAGGQLEAFKSAYDRNINNLQDQKLQAIALAEQAEREFIRTGKSDAYEAAIKLYNVAQDAHNQILNRQSEKQNMMINASTEARTNQTFLSTQATNQLSMMAQAGTDWNSISDADRNLLAEQLGISTSSVQGLYEDLKLASQFEKEGRYADFTAKITSILGSIPSGTKITIGGKEYEGTGGGSGSDYTGYSTDMKEYEYALSRGEFNGSFTDWQSLQKTKALSSSGLDSTTQNQVIAAGNKFSSQPVVQRYAKAVEAKNFVDTLAGKESGTLTSVDAQGLIYAFAKAMDPDSVVREGEYATAQKYAQSFLNATGYNLQRVWNGKTFLSPDAVKSIKNIVDDKYNSTKDVYSAEYNKSKALIDSLTGGVVDASLYLTDYESGISNIENNQETSGNEDMSW